MITKFEAVKQLVGGQLSTGPNDTFVYHDGQTPPSESAINAKLAELKAEYNAQAYARSRKAEYPPLEDQLDHIYHNGIASWKANMVKPVKDKYPKP